MMPRRTPSLTLAILMFGMPAVLCAAPATTGTHMAARSAVPPSARALEDELASHSRTWRRLEKELGARRTEELRVARFEVHRHDWQVGRTLGDDPIVAERTTDALRSSAGKLLRRRLEETPLLDPIFDRLEARRDASRAAWTEDREDRPWRLRASPRFGLGRSSYLGVKLRVRNREHPTWQRFSLSARQYLGDDDLKFRLGWEHGDRAVFVEHLHDALGDHTTSFNVRLKL